MIRTILAVALVFLTIATAADKPTLKQLYDRHRWFDLRDAIKDQDLRPARVFPKLVGNDFRYGHLGVDVLSRAREVRINFEAMTLELLPLQ